MKKFYTSLLLFTALITNSQNIELDSNFGTDGFNLLSGQTNGWSIINSKIQSNGKIIISGHKIEGSDCCINFIARLNVDGNIDSNFGSNGYITLPFFDENGPILFVLNDDSIITLSSDGDDYTNINKFTSNGIVENTFAQNGILSFTDESHRFNNDNALLYNGYIYTLFGNNIKKIDQNTGELDLTFGNNGKLSINNQYTGKLLFIHDNNFFMTRISNEQSPANKLFRVNFDGELDTSFGDNGYVTIYTAINFNALDNFNSNVAFDNNQYIYANVDNSSENYSQIKKYDIDGNIVTGFGGNGIANLDNNSRFSSLQIFNNKIYLSGIDTSGNNPNLKFIRRLTNGDPDLSFNNSGLYIENENDYYEFTESLNILSNGKIIASGEFFNQDFRKIFIVQYQDNSLSIENFDNKPKIYITNPTTGKLEIQTTNSINSFEIYDLKGSLLLKSKEYNNDINISNFNNGIYLLKLNFESNISVIKKIIKK